jgi:hypothetical protein
VSLIDDDLKRLTHTVDNCPFYVHVNSLGSGSDSFYVFFSLNKQSPYGVGDPNILACAVCTILPELYDDAIMMKVAVRSTKKELGVRKSRWDEYNWNDQSWRYDSFTMECSAAPLWNLLERSVDFERVSEQAVEDVISA